jgi:hypothetical protein
MTQHTPLVALLGVLPTAAEVQQLPQMHRGLQHEVFNPGALRDASCKSI